MCLSPELYSLARLTNHDLCLSLTERGRRIDRDAAGEGPNFKIVPDVFRLTIGMATQIRTVLR